MSSTEIEKVTLRLFEGDKERLGEYYTDVGYQKVIRNLVRQHLEMLDRQAGIDRRSQVEVMRENTPNFLDDLDPDY